LEREESLVLFGLLKVTFHDIFQIPFHEISAQRLKQRHHYLKNDWIYFIQFLGNETLRPALQNTCIKIILSRLIK
jgi:hypothetical protein